MTQQVRKTTSSTDSSSITNSVEHVAKQSHLIESQTSDKLDGIITDHLFKVSIPEHNTLDLCIDDEGFLYLQSSEDDDKTDRQTMERILDNTSLAYIEDNIDKTDDPVVTTVDDIIYKKQSMLCYIPVHDKSNKDPIYQETLLKIDEYVELSSPDLLEPIYCEIKSFPSTGDILPDINSNQEFTPTPVTFTISDDRTVTIFRPPKRNQSKQSDTLKTRFVHILQTHGIDIREVKQICLAISRAIWMPSLAFGSILLLSPFATIANILTLSILGSISFKISYNLSQGPWKIEDKTSENLTSLDIHRKLPSEKSEIISSSQLISKDYQEGQLQTVKIRTEKNSVLFTATDKTRTWEIPLENGFLSSELTDLFYEIGYEHFDEGIVTIRITPDRPNDTEIAVQSESGEWIHSAR